MFMNKSDELATLRIKLFEGEDGRLLATVRLKLKPKEMRFYDLSRIKRISGKAGLILVDADKTIFSSGCIINVEDEMKVLDYTLMPIYETRGCC